MRSFVFLLSGQRVFRKPPQFYKCRREANGHKNYYTPGFRSEFLVQEITDEVTRNDAGKKKCSDPCKRSDIS